MRTSVLLASCLLGLAAGGCSANYNTAYRTKNLEGTGPVVLTVDAKQRAIIANYRQYVRKNGNVETTELTRRFCSEPSPDVFSVLAQSLGAGGTFGKSADPASIEAALNLAFSTSEQGSSIPRTQTVNLLRELMFRTCERYVSGGYDETELSIQAVRDQRLIVSILAIESLTGAVAPKPVVIGLTGSAGAGATGEAVVRLADAQKRLETAEQAAKTAGSAYATENGADAVCNAIEGKNESDLTDDQKAKVEPCKKVRDARSAAQEELGRARSAHSELSQAVRTAGVAAQTAAITGATGGGIDRVGSPSDVAQVATTVNSIIERNFSDDTEVLLFCLKALVGTSPGSEKLAPIIPICQSFLQSRVDAATAQARAQAATARTEFTTGTNARFDQFWVQHGAKFADAAARGALADTLATSLVAPERYKADCFRSASSREVAQACFASLTIPQQNVLLLRP